MVDVLNIISELSGECHCGQSHYTSIKDVRIGSGLVNCVGEILKENNFPKDLLLVTDKNALRASEGIIESLTDFNIEYKIYDDMRIPEMKYAQEIIELISGREIGVLSVGTGSVNDPCRYAAAECNKLFCIFATAPSMDGFASYSSPLIENGFKSSYPAKSPEVIIGDTKILASSPKHLKSAGFGDMIAKYIGLADWQISSLLTDEPYCEKVAALTRSAVDRLMTLADRVTENDEETAGEIFSSLLLTGIGMSFMQNSRPASGSEHIVAHLIDCKELLQGLMPNFHGEDVGVCTLEMLKLYNDLASCYSIKAQKENVDWDKVFEFYGPLSEDVKKLNFPDTVIDGIESEFLEEKWQDIRTIIKDIPDYNTCLTAMKAAGCKTSIEDIGKTEDFFNDCVKYSPYMRRRVTLLRLIGMITLQK